MSLFQPRSSEWRSVIVAILVYEKRWFLYYAILWQHAIGSAPRRERPDCCVKVSLSSMADRDDGIQRS